LKKDIIAVIPSHLASIRFPNKILLNILGFPMIEHVRRRAMLSSKLKKNVYIATCDKKISNKLLEYSVKTISTSKKHKNGTNRVAEAIKNISCSHVILLQGDEPLLLPKYIDSLIEKIKNSPQIDAWNLTAPIKKDQQFKDNSIVKCKLNSKKEIIELYRSKKINQIFNKKKNRKILGIIAFRKDFLLKLVKLKASKNEMINSIEQSRIIDNNYKLISVNVPNSLPSINLKKDEKIVKNYLIKNRLQKKILNKIINFYEN
tara:strand:- start:1138 stop:1917 length:780 start_codon:yes stop_codon:yes gene_type:complete